MLKTAISAIFIFLMVILIHELGHFTVAKLVGIKVNEFSIGMGPKLFQRKKGETKYTVRALPIGGYVSMEGEDEDSEDPRGFGNAHPLARMAVIAAGAFMNFVLAIVVLGIVSYGMGHPTNIVSEVMEDSPAMVAEIQSGDKVVKVNDVSIETWDELTENISTSDSKKELDIVIERNNEEIDLKLMPDTDGGRTIIGIVPAYEKSMGSAVKGGFQMTGVMLKGMFTFIGDVFRGQVSTNDLSGPVGIIGEIGKASKMGAYNVLLIMGMISVNLGFFNLLPIPALDGSRLVFILLELIRGKKIDEEKEGFIHFIGFAFLITLMLIITYKDIFK